MPGLKNALDASAAAVAVASACFRRADLLRARTGDARAAVAWEAAGAALERAANAEAGERAFQPSLLQAVKACMGPFVISSGERPETRPSPQVDLSTGSTRRLRCPPRTASRELLGESSRSGRVGQRKRSGRKRRRPDPPAK